MRHDWTRKKLYIWTAEGSSSRRTKERQGRYMRITHRFPFCIDEVAQLHGEPLACPTKFQQLSRIPFKFLDLLFCWRRILSSTIFHTNRVFRVFMGPTLLAGIGPDGGSAPVGNYAEPTFAQEGYAYHRVLFVCDETIYKRHNTQPYRCFVYADV